MGKDIEKEIWIIVEELRSWGILLSGANDLEIEGGKLNGLGLRLNTIAKQLELLKDEISE